MELTGDEVLKTNQSEMDKTYIMPDLSNLAERKTLRDEMAMAALSELVKVAYYSPEVRREDEDPTEAERIAGHAYIYASAMMNERSRNDR